MARKRTNSLEDQLARAEQRRALEEARAAAELAKLRTQAAKLRRRRLSTYDGAKKDRRDRDWTSKQVSADAAIIPDLAIVNARARALIRDTAPGRSIIRSFKRNVIGRGITPSSTPEIGTEASREAFAKAAESAWTDYAADHRAIDAEGVKTWQQIQAQAVSELVAVGGVLLRVVAANNGPDHPGLRVQLIEVEQLDTSKTRHAATGNEIKGGIEVDTVGRPVAYHVYDRAASAPALGRRASAQSKRLLEAEVEHLYLQEIPGQTRGISDLATILRKTRDLTEYDSLELWSARIQANLGIAITRPMGSADQDLGYHTGSTSDDTDDNANPLANWEGGMIYTAEPGENVEFFTPNRPSGQYEPFTRAQLRQIAAATGLSYEQVARDFTAGNFSSQRQALLEDRREWEALQLYMIDRLCRPVWRQFLDVMVLEGRITAPAYFAARRLYQRADWQPDGWAWIDPAREAAAAKIALEQRIETRDRILNRQGTSVRAIFEQREKETALADRHNVALPEEAAPEPAPEGTPGAPPGEPKPGRTPATNAAPPTEPDAVAELIEEAVAED